MKKITALLLACLMMVSLLAGCGGDTTNGGNTDVAPEDRVLHMRTTSTLLSTDWQASTLTSDIYFRRQLL